MPKTSDFLETFQVFRFTKNDQMEAVGSKFSLSDYQYTQRNIRAYTTLGAARSYRTRLGRARQPGEFYGHNRQPLDVTTIRILRTRVYPDGTVTTDWID
jgi:hypothetical protein